MEEILIPVSANQVEILAEQPDNAVMAKRLIENSKAAIMAAVELHNKPVFPYRYEMTVILTINAWELALKAYLLTYRPDIKVLFDDYSKEFLNCLGSVHNHLHDGFLAQKENIELIYKYRCYAIHFYTDGIEVILYSLLRPNILYYSEFMLKYFKIDLADETNLIILPIGFKKTLSPIDFMNEKLITGNPSTVEFLNSIKKSAQTLEERGITDGLICNYQVNIESVNKVKNADIIVGITNDPLIASLLISKSIKAGSFTHDENAPKFKIEEESLFKTTFTMNYDTLIKKIREVIPSFRISNKNAKIIKEQIKKDADCYRVRFLDIIPHTKSVGKGYYSEVGLAKAISLFKDN